MSGGGTSTVQGGAIAAANGANVEINVCTFERNQATYVSAIFEPDSKQFLTKRALSDTLGGMYEVPGTEWQLESWPKPPVIFQSRSALSKIIRYS